MDFLCGIVFALKAIVDLNKCKNNLYWFEERAFKALHDTSIHVLEEKNKNNNNNNYLN